MSKKSDDSLESFFRKGVAQQDTSSLERDWQQMEKMLDERDAAMATLRPKKARPYKIGAAVAIVLLALWSGYRFGFESTVDTQAAAGTVAPGDEANDQTADLLSQDKKAAKTGSRPSEERHSRAEVASDPANNSSGGSQAVIQSEGARVPPAHTTGETQEKSNHSSRSFKTNRIEQAGSVSTPSTDNVLDATVYSGRKDVTASSLQYALTSGKPNQEIVSDELTVEIPPVAQAALLPAELQPAFVSEDQPATSSNDNRFNISAMIAPDFSATTLGKYTAPGSAFGLSLGYRIGRFTVTTGAIKSAKRYTGYGKDYSPPEGYWKRRTNGIVPSEIFGRCGIVEVPLIVQYDLSSWRRSRLFGSLGVSSYFMRSESYEYTFKEPNPGAADHWTAPQPSSYYFGVGHVSLGYDRKLNEHFSLGVEPYVKIPFKGIGWSNVNLVTAGAYVNLRYFFSFVKLDHAKLN